MFVAALLALLAALLALLLLRAPPLPVPPPVQLPRPPDPPTRHVSFSLASSATPQSLSAPPSVSLPSHRRWSSPFNKRKSPASDPPHPYTAQTPPVPVDQFGRFSSSSRPASFHTHPSPKSPRRLFTPPRFSLSGRWRSSSVSTPIPLDQVDTRPPPSTAASLPSPPPQRTRFVNPFKKHSRSRTLSPPSI